MKKKLKRVMVSRQNFSLNLQWAAMLPSLRNTRSYNVLIVSNSNGCLWSPHSYFSTFSTLRGELEYLPLSREVPLKRGMCFRILEKRQCKPVPPFRRALGHKTSVRQIATLYCILLTFYLEMLKLFNLIRVQNLRQYILKVD